MNLSFRLLIALFAIAASVPAMALDGKDCQARTAKLPDAQRSVELQKCLNEASSPASTKQKTQAEKQTLCEQNAKNQNLQGNAKSSYLSSCMNQNEAAEAAKASAAKQPAPEHKKPAAATKPADKQKPSKKTCSADANKKGLKGDERKEFMKTCMKG